jgi:hypothetical protein
MRGGVSICTIALLLLASCGGGGGGGAGSPPPPPVAAINRAEAFRFLTQATFGPTETEADRVIQLGYEGWIDEQLALPASGHLSYMRSLPQPVQQYGATLLRWFGLSESEIDAAVTGLGRFAQRDLGFLT